MLPSMIGLFVFLGNPGKEYARTRHNAGFLLLDYLRPSFSGQLKYHGLFSSEGKLRILKPMTMMNRSGLSVRECASFYKIPAENILIAHDDLELPLGAVRLQKGGGLQGHNGLRSVKESLGSDSFHRLRIGIGRPAHGDVRLYVTSPFTADELITLHTAFDDARKEMEKLGFE